MLKILDAANWAPSALNLQPWEFLVVSGAKKNMLGSNYGKIAEDYTKDWDIAPDKKGFSLWRRTGCSRRVN